MIDVYVKDCEFFQNGKFKTITFLLYSKFSDTIEFKVDLKKSKVFESLINIFGNNYMINCKVKTLNYYDIISEGLKIDKNEEHEPEISESNTNLSIEYIDTRNFDRYNFGEIKKTYSTEAGSHFTNVIRNPGRCLKYNFYLDSLVLYCKKVHSENKIPYPDHIYSVNEFILRAKEKLSNTYLDMLSYGIKLTKFNKRFKQSIYRVELELIPNTIVSSNYYRNKEEFILEVGRNISEKRELNYFKESSNINYVNLITLNKRYDGVKEIEKQFTMSDFKEFYISYNNEFLFDCIFSYRDLYNVYPDHRTIYLFIFSFDDFIKIKYKIFFNSKIELIDNDGKTISFNFTRKLSKIYWVTYNQKIFMFINIRKDYNSEVKNDENDIYRTINSSLIGKDLSEINDSFIEINCSEPNKKSKFNNFFEDSIGIYYHRFYEESENYEESEDEDWNNLDVETKLQEDPMRYIDKENNEEDRRRDDELEEEYMDKINKERDEKYEKKLKNIEIIVLEFEIHSYELIKLKILLTPKYLTFKQQYYGDNRQRDYEISSMFMFRILNFQNYDFSDIHSYIGVINNDFFIAILNTNSMSIEILSKIFNQPLKLICNNKDFKLYKGDYENINLIHTLKNKSISNIKVELIDESLKDIVPGSFF